MADDKKLKGFNNDFGFGRTDRVDIKAMPLRVQAIGAFGGANHFDGARAIDAHDFDAVLAKLAPRLVLQVENLLGTGKTLDVDLTFKSIKDFEPASLAARIPGLDAVAEFARRTKGLADGSLKPAQFKEGLSQFSAVPKLQPALDAVLDRMGGAPKPAAASGEGGLDSLFAMVDEKKEAPSGSAVAAFAGSLSTGKAGLDVSGAQKLAEKLLADQLKLITAEPALNALEAAWRGLHLFCRKGKGARIEVVDAEPGNELEAWQAATQDELAGTCEVPLGLALLATPVTNDAAGNALLHELGDYAGLLQAPVVFEAGEAFLGMTLPELAKLDHPGAQFDTPAFDKWRSLRDKDESRWLVAAVNPFVLRTGLWGSPVWLVGASVAQSMQRTGWPTQHTGAGDGEVEQLKTHAHDGGEFPLQAILPDRHLKDLTRAGFTPLICQANHDSAWVILAPTVHRPSRAEEEGKMGSLAHQLLAARLGEAVMRGKARLMQADTAEAAQAFEEYAKAVVSDTGPGHDAAALVREDYIELHIRTGREVLNGAELQFQIPV